VTNLAVLENATQMLAHVRKASDAKKLMDMAAAAEYYARKQKLGQDAIAHATSIKTQAKAMLGHYLKNAPKNRGAKGSKVTGTRQVPVRDETPTLADLGLSKNEAAEAMLLDTVKIEDPAKFQEIAAGETTVTRIKREMKECIREARRRENAKKVKAVPPVEAVNAAKFATIVIDPPWDSSDEGDVNQFGRAKVDYATMPIEELLAIDIGSKADEDCHIYLWITNRSLPKGFVLLEAWGFRYVTMLTWAKPSFGMGNYFRGQTEHILFGVRGSQLLKRKDQGTIFTAPRGKRHSEKPAAFFEIVESCSPGPYLEIFSRSEREHWSAWGEASAGARWGLV
jgi:N6-adenosine-specific RNA methylase IME4